MTDNDCKPLSIQHCLIKLFATQFMKQLFYRSTFGTWIGKYMEQNKYLSAKFLQHWLLDEKPKGIRLSYSRASVLSSVLHLSE